MQCTTCTTLKMSLINFCNKLIINNASLILGSEPSISGILTASDLLILKSGHFITRFVLCFQRLEGERDKLNKDLEYTKQNLSIVQEQLHESEARGQNNRVECEQIHQRLQELG